MSSDLQSALQFLQINDDASLIVITAVVYDYRESYASARCSSQTGMYVAIPPPQSSPSRERYVIPLSTSYLLADKYSKVDYIWVRTQQFSTKYWVSDSSTAQTMGLGLYNVCSGAYKRLGGHSVAHIAN
ncbi:hypothetical protein J3R83DRAFT_14053 [Lanmaoa asiatica]|nr:hypothetical protein J3R83DRAFT_14053 [Lanmaoa asiatica]